MTDVYEKCPVFEDENYLLRFVEETDASDLLEVYSDKNALPFFNSDNCNGDNFYYPTEEKMLEAIKFWLFSYRERYFVRFTVIDKSVRKAVGTVELFRRDSNDKFDGDGVLRLDVKSDYEKENILFNILSIIIPPAFELFNCDEIITKVPDYAVERIKAVQKFGFAKSEYLMIGTHDGYAYKGYWTIQKNNQQENIMIGKIVTVTIDRPLGSYHPKYKDMYYPINYGYIEGIIAPDGEEQDAYILGVDKAVEKFTGKIIAIIHRFDDVEEKWVVCPENISFSKEEIMEQVKFQEQYYQSEIIM